MIKYVIIMNTMWFPLISYEYNLEIYVLNLYISLINYLLNSK